jgi:hypothetical protein
MKMRLFVGLLVAVACAALGCVPEEVVWLLDSTGFVYTTGEDVSSIHLYKLETRSWQTIVVDSKALSGTPAVSPDGTRVAVVRALNGAKEQVCQVLVYDLAGRQMHESKRIGFPAQSALPSADLVMTASYWSPDEEHILFSTGSVVGSYNLATSEASVYENCSLPPLKISLIRPDGKGFVAFQKTGHNKETMGFMTWDWKWKAFESPEAVKQQVGDSGTPVEHYWRGQELILVSTGGQANCDTSTGKWSREGNTTYQRLEDLFKSVVTGAVAISDGKTQAYVLSRELPTETEGKKRASLVTWADRDGGGPFEVAELTAGGEVSFSPSPDRKHLVVTAVDRKGDARLFVFDSSARLLTSNVRNKSFPASIPTKRNGTTLPPEYPRVARHLCDSASFDASRAPQSNFTESLAEAQSALLDLQQADPTDRDLTYVVSEGTIAVEEIVASLKRTASLPRPPGFGEQFVGGFVLGLAGQFDEATRLDQKWRREQEGLLAEAHKFSGAFRKIDAAKRLLPRVASRYSGPNVESGQAIDVAFVNRWGPRQESDILIMGLNLEKALVLHNCTIKASLFNDANEVAHNIHFVKEWNTRDYLIARYGAGVKFDSGETIAVQTVADVNRIEISLWCDELSQEKINYLHTISQKDEAASGACANVKLPIEYVPYREGLLGSNRGVRVTMNGVTRLPACTVRITFHRGDGEERRFESESLWWTLPEWKGGVKKTFLSPKFTWNPETIDVTISFADTRHTISETLNVAR